MLKGIDISNYQADTPSGYDFYIIKASEGVGWKDPKLDSHFNKVKTMTDLYGFYHYARPDLGNTPEQEADYFLSLVGHHAGKAIFALDWEGKSLNYSTDWALKWLNRVYEKTGVKPVLYTSGSQVWSGKYKNIAGADYGLWIAQWGVSEPQLGSGWKVWALWQYQGAPLDKDYFNGNRDTWFKYCGSKKTPESKPKPQTPKKGNYAIALDVLKGKYGNGSTRKTKLAQAGYDYNSVQNYVNRLIDVANKTIRGDYGNEPQRSVNLKKAGYNPNIIQQAVNILI